MTDFNEAPEGADAIAVKAGRRGATYTDVQDWVTFSDICPESKALYVILRAHVNRQRADDLVWTSTLALSKVMTYSRGDKITKFIRDLERIGAIDVDRNNVHGRMVFIVNQEPPAGYDGPLTAGEWHRRNKEELDRVRAEEKAKRDARRARAKGQQESSSAPVHPEQGEQAVHPERGDVVTPKRGDVQPPVSGREPDVLEPDGHEPLKTLADASAAADSSSVQTTIDGKDETVGKVDKRTADQLLKDTGAGITRWWFEGWAGKGTPIAGEGAFNKLRVMVVAFLRAGYTEDEIKNACRKTGVPTVPTSHRLQTELAALRGVSLPAARSGGSRSTRVNDHWKQKAETGAAGVVADDGYVPPAAAEIQKTGAFW
jgi:hypothetical protein